MKRFSFLFLLMLSCLLFPGCGGSQPEKAPASAKKHPAADQFRSPSTSVPSALVPDSPFVVTEVGLPLSAYTMP